VGEQDVTKEGTTMSVTSDRPVLVADADSSSLRPTVFGDGGEILADHRGDSPPGEDAAGPLRRLSAAAPTPSAVGHRIVHGGPELRGHQLIDDDVRAALDRAAALAPLHVPPALTVVDAARDLLPGIPHVACFDTVFHAGLPAAAREYAVPSGWREDFGLRRYGFHGLSYAWALDRAAELLDRRPENLHLVIAHLGGGCSACAVRDGRSVDTTMGFTPLEGLVMSHRSGSVDPGALTWLQNRHKLSAPTGEAQQVDRETRALLGGRHGGPSSG
jgi:acetate kinase